MTPARRALCVSTSLATRGGIASYVRMLRETPLWSRWDVHHVATHRDGSPAAKVGQFAVAVPRYLAELLLRRPAVVHLHMSAHGSFVRKAALFWIARAARVPVLVHVHGSEFDTFHDRLPVPLQAVVRATLDRAAAVVALGGLWAQRLRNIAPDAHVVTVPNAIRVPPAPRRPADRSVRVVFLGEIGERKGAFVLIEAWAKVAVETEGTVGAHLVLAGDRGVDQARELARERGIDDSVTVLDWVTPDDAARLLAGADVFVLPSRSEGQPMALLEAMAHGLCVISTPVGGVPEMVDDGCSGLLVPTDDIEALAAALRRVIADGGLRARLGAAARARVLERFDIEVVWRRLDALYEEASA